VFRHAFAPLSTVLGPFRKNNASAGFLTAQVEELAEEFQTLMA
jgi:hypothetical protein